MRYGRRRKKTQRGAHGREEDAFACSGAKSEEQIRTGGQARKEGTGRRMVIGVHYLWAISDSSEISNGSNTLPA